MYGDQLAPLRAISDLVDTARWRENVARYHEWTDLQHLYSHCARQLDAARTMLVQEGHQYAPEAWAFIDAARVQLYNLALAEELR